MNEDDSKPMNPDVEPPGYKPPTGAEELLERYAKGERYFSRARLMSARLPESHLDQANLRQAVLMGADLHGSSLIEVDLREADLQGANLQGADLRGAQMWRAVLQECDLQGAVLRGARLTWVNARGALLHGADLGDVELQNAAVFGAEISAATYRASHWTPDELRLWLLKGIQVADWEALPDEVRPDLRRERAEGLTLYFNTRLTPFNRFLIDGVIFGVLGKDTDCRVVQFEERGNNAIIRLQAVLREDLEAVADALWDRVWEEAKKVQQTALMRLAEGLVLNLQPGLSDLRDQLDRMELRLPSPEAKEMLDDQGEEHWREKNFKVIRCWPEKVVRAIGKKAAQKAGEEVVDGVACGLKGLLKGGKEGE